MVPPREDIFCGLEARGDGDGGRFDVGVIGIGDEREESMTVAPSPSVKVKSAACTVSRRVGASLTAVMVTVEVTVDEESVPSLTTQEMVRFAVLGFSEVLL